MFESQLHKNIIFSQLTENDVTSADDFVWLSRLRYYCTDVDKTTEKAKRRDDGFDDDDQDNLNTAVELRMMYRYGMGTFIHGMGKGNCTNLISLDWSSYILVHLPKRDRNVS